MAIQPMALGVDTTPVNAMQDFAQGATAGMQLENMKRDQAMKGIKMIGSIALGAKGGDIKGQVDPVKYEQGLDLLEKQGIDVKALRGKPEYAEVAARASMTAIEQINVAQNEQQYQLALKRFEQELNGGTPSGYRPTAEGNLEAVPGGPADPGNPLNAKKANGAQSPIGKLAEDFAAGLIDKKTYDAAIAKATQGNNGITIGPDGTVQIGGMPKLTEAQSKDVVYATRAAGSLPIIDEFGDTLTSIWDQGLENAPGGVGRYFQGEDYQKAKQAGDEFLAAILRKDTGAAITADEQKSYGNTYLPRPGDKSDVLAQKKAARQRALKALSLAIPAQAILAMEEAGVDVTKLTGEPTAPSEDNGTNITEGTIIENDAGQRMQLRNGVWEPMN